MALPVVSMGLPRPWISVSDTEHQINPIKGDDSRKLSEWVSLCKIKRGDKPCKVGGGLQLCRGSRIMARSRKLRMESFFF